MLNESIIHQQGPLMCDGRLAHLLLPVLLLLRAPMLYSFGERICPNNCRCEGKTVHCDSSSLLEVPENITVGSQGLSLRYNELQTLLPYQFAHLEATAEPTFGPTSGFPPMLPTDMYDTLPPYRPRPIPNPTVPGHMSKNPRDSMSRPRPTQPPPPEYEHMTLHKVVVGSVALFFTMSLILTIVYVAWRRYPAATRLLQESSVVGRKRRKKSPEPEQNLSSQLQEYYMSYNPHAASPEALEVLGNGTGSCTCTLTRSRECEV
uniref:Uncharacterized protein n=1 Tax=Knipowitschia caucasica TaxID=637954 RepID=A0AAV2J110_KNICA